jgi:putative Mn2+ efflux pump MntP
VLKLLAFCLPLALDTFAVAAALGVAGLPAGQRLRVSLLFTAFEAGMPILGLLVGHALGHAIGSIAELVAAIALIALGVYLLAADEQDETTRARTLARTHGLAVIGLGLSISLDELAIGFSIGVLHFPLAPAIALIAAQAFVAAQLGVRLGSRLSERAREGAERAAGVALVMLGVVLLVTHLR